MSESSISKDEVEHNNLHRRHSIQEDRFCTRHFLDLLEMNHSDDFLVGSTKRYTEILECSLCLADAKFIVIL